MDEDWVEFIKRKENSIFRISLYKEKRIGKVWKSAETHKLPETKKEWKKETKKERNKWFTFFFKVLSGKKTYNDFF